MILIEKVVPIVCPVKLVIFRGAPHPIQKSKKPNRSWAFNFGFCFFILGISTIRDH